MKKTYLLTATAGILLALAGPSLAASRSHSAIRNSDVNTVRTYGDRDPSNPPYAYSPSYNTYNRANTGPQSGYGPYPDRPYGDPDSW